MSIASPHTARRASTLITEQLRGVVTRLLATVSVLSAAVGGPFVIGAVGYGEALSLLAVPYIVQGVLEPIIIAVQIRWLPAPGAAGRIQQLRRHLAVAGTVGILLSWALLAVMPCVATATLPRMAAIGGILALSIVNAYMIGAAYAVALHTQLWRSYSCYIATFWTSLLLLRDRGPDGFLLSVCTAQVALLTALGASRAVREHATIRGVGARSNARDFLAEYSLALSPRLARIVLGPVTIALGAVSMTAASLAAYKVALTIANAVKLALPISPETIQASFSRSAGEGRSHSRRSARRLFAALFVAAIFVSCVAYAFRDFVYQKLLGIPQPESLRIIFLAMPFMFLIEPIGSYLLATRRSSALALAVSTAVLCMIVVGVVHGIPFGFVAGSIGYVAAAAATHWLTGQRDRVCVFFRAGRRLVGSSPQSLPEDGTDRADGAACLCASKQERTVKDYYEDYWSDGVDVSDHDVTTPARMKQMLATMEAYCRWGDRILDLGCGAGRFTAALHRHGYDALGLDIAEGAIGAARQRYPDVRFDVLRPDGAIPAEDHSFAAVWSTEVIEHVLDVSRFLSEIRRVLRPGGIVVLTTPYHGLLKNSAIVLFNFHKHFNVEGSHIRFFDRRALTRSLSKNQFEPLSLAGLGRFWPLYRTWFVVAKRAA